MLSFKSELEIKSSHSKYQLVNGIPRFVESESYTKSFGEQWHLFQLTQLDSYSKLNLSHERLRRCFGNELWENLRDKLVLECGCGAGRFTEVLLEQGAKVVSVDLSRAVEVNAKNFPLNETHLVLQADIANLPFVNQQFDFVVCLGVLQHTAAPEETLVKLFEQLKPGGFLIVDQYIFTKSHWSLRLLYREFLKRMEPKNAFKVISFCGRIFLPLHKLAANSKWARVLLNRFSPMVTYYTAFPELTDDLQTEWALLDTFDTLTDSYRSFGTPESLKRNLNKAGFKNIYVALGGNGVEARAQRPL